MREVAWFFELFLGDEIVGIFNEASSIAMLYTFSTPSFTTDSFNTSSVVTTGILMDITSLRIVAVAPPTSTDTVYVLNASKSVIV